MIWIDYTLLGLVFISFIFGLLRGLIRELYSLGFWILGIWISLNFSCDFSVFLVSSIKHSATRIIASFIALFAITLSFSGLIGFLLTLLSKKTGLTFMDRFGGMILGTVRGMVVVTVVVILAGLTPLTKDSWWSESTIIPPFQSLAIWLRDHLSSGMVEYIRYS